MNQPVAAGKTYQEAGQDPASGRAREGARRFRWSWVVYGFVFLVAGAIVAFNTIRPITVLPRITPSPGYAFTNQDGQLVTSEDARGRLTLYSLSYAGCEEGCAQPVEQIAAVQAALADRIPADTPLAFMTISVDPTAEAEGELQTMLARAQAIVPSLPFRWDFVTAAPERTKQVIGRGFSVYYGDPVISDDGARQITFDPRYVLVDGLGIMRAEYRTATPDPDLLARDVNYLMGEARNSKGVARLGYEAAHLFSCYPR